MPRGGTSREKLLDRDEQVEDGKLGGPSRSVSSFAVLRAILLAATVAPLAPNMTFTTTPTVPIDCTKDPSHPKGPCDQGSEAPSEGEDGSQQDGHHHHHHFHNRNEEALLPF
eukprot:TRINITY_DN3870_c0_g1_i2.p2 TRINITY_DN3870_c0_g1~~TRINITY_DN3870_c0_g1_i2.p2  ORF type:complete len:112 (+),score=12.85 TRINITY_DN3870_c0_g1_i2:263-598(+)